MSTLWAFGDSFTRGSGIVDCTRRGGKYLAYFKGKEKLIWPELLADYLSYNLKNISSNGYSNQQLIELVIKNFFHFDSNDIVLIGLGKYTRTLMYTDSGEISVMSSNLLARKNELKLHSSSFAKDLLDYRKRYSEEFYNNTHLYINFIKNLLDEKSIKNYIWDPSLWNKYTSITQETGGDLKDIHWGINGNAKFFELLKSELNV